MTAKVKKRAYRKDLQDDLIRMAGKYLDSIGGKGIVGGPCCIIQMPGSTETNFYVAVKMLGHKPPKLGEGHGKG